MGIRFRLVVGLGVTPADKPDDTVDQDHNY